MRESDEKTLLDRKLAELALSNPSGREIANEVASTSEATAELFSSRYRPPLLKGAEGGADHPDGVAIRFARR